jgi:hypothetical protein
LIVIDFDRGPFEVESDLSALALSAFVGLPVSAWPQESKP